MGYETKMHPHIQSVCTQFEPFLVLKPLQYVLLVPGAAVLGCVTHVTMDVCDGDLNPSRVLSGSLTLGSCHRE